MAAMAQALVQRGPFQAHRGGGRAALHDAHPHREVAPV